MVTEHEISVSLGAQDVSAFPDGAYTGEVGADQIKEFADFVIIGHSERRKYQGETVEQIAQKVIQAQAVGLTVILCVQDENDPIPDGVDLVAFEPPSAISTFGVGKAEDPQEVNRVFNILQTKTNAVLIYGGSVDASDISNYRSVEHLSGFLIGGASLEPESFSQLIKTW
jgi:triosephosphate isomerase